MFPWSGSARAWRRTRSQLIPGRFSIISAFTRRSASSEHRGVQPERRHTAGGPAIAGRHIPRVPRPASWCEVGIDDRLGCGKRDLGNSQCGGGRDLTPACDSGAGR